MVIENVLVYSYRVVRQNIANSLYNRGLIDIHTGEYDYKKVEDLYADEITIQFNLLKSRMNVIFDTTEGDKLVSYNKIPIKGITYIIGNIIINDLFIIIYFPTYTDYAYQCMVFKYNKFRKGFKYFSLYQITDAEIRAIIEEENRLENLKIILDDNRDIFI